MPAPAYTRFGNNLTSLVETSDSPLVEFQADGVVMITRRWHVDSSIDITSAPKPKDIDPLGYNARCVSTSVQHGPANMSFITSVFQGYTTLPPNIYEFANSRMDRPIQQHPKFNDGVTFPDNTKNFVAVDPKNPISVTNRTFSKFQDSSSIPANLIFAGIEAYIVGSAQWRKTSYSLQPDTDQSDVGKLNPPEGGIYQTLLPDPSNAGKKWLKMEKTTRNMLKGASILWETTEVWQFNDRTWENAIYGP